MKKEKKFMENKYRRMKKGKIFFEKEKTFPLKRAYQPIKTNHIFN